jgi:ABC-type uncharacterized transport system substrate-binding protein
VSPRPQEDLAVSQARQAIEQLAAANARAALAVGDEAALTALETLPTTPVVFCMIPNALDIPFLAPDYRGRNRIAGVTTDIDPVQQIEWVAALSPRLRSLCIPCGPRSARTAAAIEAAAKARGITASPVDVRKQQFGSALQLLESKAADGVIMIADSDVYDSGSVRELLLWGLRNKKAVWSFTPNIVEAGAFAGQYAEAGSIGQQAAEVTRRVIAGEKIAGIGLQYPSVIRTAINERTAEMIGMDIETRVLNRATIRYGENR